MSAAAMVARAKARPCAAAAFDAVGSPPSLPSPGVILRAATRGSAGSAALPGPESTGGWGLCVLERGPTTKCSSQAGHRRVYGAHRPSARAQ